jgi:hypothetical protein
MIRGVFIVAVLVVSYALVLAGLGLAGLVPRSGR